MNIFKACLDKISEENLGLIKLNYFFKPGIVVIYYLFIISLQRTLMLYFLKYPLKMFTEIGSLFTATRTRCR